MTLDELDALHAAATAGEWQRAPASGRILADGWPVPMSDPATTAAIIALHNAWPAISARLRAAEAAVERLRGALFPIATGRFASVSEACDIAEAALGAEAVAVWNAAENARAALGEP